MRFQCPGGHDAGHSATTGNAALGVLTLLSILGIAFASLMRLERKAAENYVDGKRMDLLLDSALDRTVASLQGAKNYRSYTVYRGLVSDLPVSYGTATLSGVVSEGASDPSVPPANTAYFYLVTVSNRLDEEGTKGNDSSGAERQVKP